MDDRGIIEGGDAEAEAPEGHGRRDLMKKAAIGGAVLWVAPIVLSAPVAAASRPLGPEGGEDWNPVDPQPPGNGWQAFGTINPTGWTGNNVDVVGPTFSGAAGTWLAGRQWVDLVGSGTAGSVTRSFAVGPGLFMIKFQYGRYSAADVTSTLTLTVSDNAPVPLPLNPASMTAQVFQNSFTTTSAPLVITISGTGTGNVGPALGTLWISHWT